MKLPFRLVLDGSVPREWGVDFRALIGQDQSDFATRKVCFARRAPLCFKFLLVRINAHYKAAGLTISCKIGHSGGDDPKNAILQTTF
jgi:hypothetical protein